MLYSLRILVLLLCESRRRRQARNDMGKSLLLVAILVTIFALPTAQAADWPQWRGPNGDGVSPETDWDPEALRGSPTVLWTADIGPGYSSVVIRDDRLYTAGRVEEGSAFQCLNAFTGALIWSRSYDDYSQPQSTPVIDGDRVYGLGADGMLFCLQKADGTIEWKKSLRKDFKAWRPRFYCASSLVVEGDKLLVNANTAALVLDKMSGDLKWRYDDTLPSDSFGSYTTPVACDLDGARCALFLGPSNLMAVDLSTGKLMWSYSHKDTTHPVADPIVFGSRVFLSLTNSCALLEMAAGGPRTLWSSSEFDTWLPSRVLVNGYLYGTHFPESFSTTTWGGVQAGEFPFRCLEWDTGKVVWEKYMKYVSLIAADGKLIMLELNGTLHIAEATAAGYQELSSADVLQGAKRPRTFATPPVLCNGLLYCRNFAGDLVCIDVRAKK